MDVSIVIPVYNEEKNIKPLYTALYQAAKNSKVIENYEIIFVDDGSTDKTYGELNSIKDSKLHIIRFKKNRGKTTALNCGFKKTKYDVIATLDGDLQNDPSDIEGMLKKLKQGYDCVCGWRYNRNDSLLKIMSSKIANFIRRLVLKDKFHDIGCGMLVFKKSCLRGLIFFEGIHRFFPILIQKAGYKVTEHKIKHHPRKFGKSKYNIRNRIFKSLKDLIYVKRMLKKKQ